MINLNKNGYLRRRVLMENPIAIGITKRNGDMEYRTQLKDGTIVDFFVPNKNTFIGKGYSKMTTQEYSKRLLKFIK